MRRTVCIQSGLSSVIRTGKYGFFLLTLMVAGGAFADGASDYKAGADYAKQIKGQGMDSIQTMKPGESIPGYNANPGETKYYGGVTATGDAGLKNDGVTTWGTSETGKAVTESFINNPKEPISPDAPFIKASKDVESRADSIIGNTGMQCQAQQINRSEFTNYTCERDLNVEQYCTRTATITGHFVEETVTRSFTVPNSRFTFRYDGNKSVYFSFAAPASGTVQSASLSLHFDDKNMYYRMTFWGIDKDSVAQRDNTWVIPGAPGAQLAEGQASPEGVILNKNCLNGNQSRCRDYARKTFDWLKSGAGAYMSATLTMQVKERKWVPDVVWTESCPFSKAEGTLTRTDCTEPGGTKTVWMEGKPYQVSQSCWSYRDTYLTQAADAGSCKTYTDNPACSLSTRSCAFRSDSGTCLHEYATYSCETRASGQVMLCGGDVFCLDGECDRAQNGINGDFSSAVSQLAALAAAGKDVAAKGGVDVRVFTGKAKFCKKFAAGFSNCCKDSGWGQDAGLASCSSDEKALARAKEDKLTVSVGEFCSKDVLGVCLEKKRSYCQFDSKLAQIVQQQGRNGQLRIGFGSASSPDCRGLTVNELETIKFDQLNFANFYSDLMKNQKIPANNTLTDKVKAQIAAQMKSATGQ